MIIWLASYPRSGNTFFRLLLKCVYDLPSYSIYQFTIPNKWGIAKTLGIKTETDLSFDDMAIAHSIHLVKTHNLPQEDFPATYLVRDGRDALVSYAHHILDYAREIPKHEQPAQFTETLRMLIETDNHQIGHWSKNVRAWTERSTCTVVVKFEELIEAPIEHLRRAMAGVGYQPPEIEAIDLPAFSQLHERFPDFFRKGRVGAWREEMPEDLHDRFWQKHGEVMLEIGYNRD